MRCDELRLTGSGGANRVMEAELKRLVMRSPFEVRVPKPRREGEATLLYPFDARIAWVAACHHRTSSRISWDLFSSPAVRLEPLFEELLPALRADDRLPAARTLRLLGGPRVCPRLRGVTAAVARRREERAGRGARLARRQRRRSMPTRPRWCSSRGEPARLRAAAPSSGIDIGLGARHRRGARVASGPAPLRETMAAQLIMLSRWDARIEPLVDPDGRRRHDSDRGGRAWRSARRSAVRRTCRSATSPRSPGCPSKTPDLFPGTVPRILALDVDEERIPAMVGNLRAAGLTGPSYEDSIVIGQKDVRALTPDDVAAMLPACRRHEAGRLLLQPALRRPHRRRTRASDRLLDLYAGMGRALARFTGWRAACFVANPASSRRSATSRR